MPPSPIVATDRMVFRYTVDGLVHRQTAYFLATPSADPLGFNAVARPGGTDPACSALCDAFFTPLAPFFNPAHDSFDSMTFEQSLGTQWIPVGVVLPTVVPTGSGAVDVAFGVDVVGKDFAHRTFHAYVYEGAFGGTGKTTSYSSMNTNTKRLVDYYYEIGGFINFEQAWNWRRSRTSNYAQNFLSYVGDSNQKLRRSRGVA